MFLTGLQGSPFICPTRETVLSATGTLLARSRATVGIFLVKEDFWVLIAANLVLGAKSCFMADHAMVGGGHLVASEDVVAEKRISQHFRLALQAFNM